MASSDVAAGPGPISVLMNGCSAGWCDSSRNSRMPARMLFQSRSVASRFCSMRGAARGSADASRTCPREFRAQHDQPARETVGKWLRERRQIGARLEQGRGDEEQLDVGNRLARIAFEECGGPTRQVGCEAGAEHEALGDAQGQAVEPHVVLERAALAARVGDERGDVILQVLADAAQGDSHRDSLRAELVGVADPGQHQQLRRVDRAAREDHLTLRPHDGLLAMADVLDADDTRAVEQQPGHQRLDLHGQVGARQRRAQIGDRAAAAPAMLDRHLHAREAVLLRAVVILGRRQAGRAGGIHHRRRKADPRSATFPSPADRRSRDRRRLRPPSAPADGNTAAHARRTIPSGLRPPSGRNRRGCREHRPSR